MLVVLCTLLLAAAADALELPSSSCIPTVSTVPVPPSIEDEISAAFDRSPSVLTIGRILSTLELSAPTLSQAEATVEYYEQLYGSTVREIESMYNSPWLYTEPDEITGETVAYPSLASAVSYIISIEHTQSLLAEYQPNLQLLEEHYSTILSALSAYTQCKYPSLRSASQIVTKATLIDPSIFASVIAVSTAVQTSYTVSGAVSYLSAAMYSIPATVVADVITMISSPSIVSGYVVDRLISCYPTLYSELTVVTSFIYSYPSVVSDLTGLLDVAQHVSGLGSAVSLVAEDQMPTLVYELTVLSHAQGTLPQLFDDLQVLTVITAQSPALREAESTLEASFYASPSVASAIFDSLDSPSLVTDPSAVSNDKHSHVSFVKAVSYLLDWEVGHPATAVTLSSVQSQLVSVFQHYRTVLTAYSYVHDVTSPIAASASQAILSAKSIVSDLTYVLTGLTYIVSRVPSLACDESVEEYYAKHYESLASFMWSVLDGQTAISKSQLSSWRSLVSSHTSLLNADNSILYAYQLYSNIESLQASFIQAAASDESLLTQYEVLNSEYQWAFSEYYTESYAYSSSTY